MMGTIRDILLIHAKRYPAWTVEDVYKLVQQSSLGSEHAVDNDAAAEEWLGRELREIGEGPEEPLLDPISPDGEIVRVHLRPYLGSGLDMGLLLAGFVQTARGFHGSRALIGQYAQVAAALAREARLGMSDEVISHFFEEMRANGFPAIHHSKSYQEHYRPAYRVAARRFVHPDILEAGASPA